ncbi:MAG: RluA family pseudouridine synthase [Clostridiales bacterium]|nr:RluA family pseudouridine synthase [Clostridiales bacterium]
MTGHEDKTTHTYHVPAAQKRLDVFLMGASGLTRSAVSQHIQEGRVTVDGCPAAKAGERLRAGQAVTLLLPPPMDLLERADIPLAVLYEDADIVVINKQQGLTVHPAGTNRDKTLVNALLFHVSSLSGINGVIRPGIVHRLDKDTSGVMVVAKNDRAHLGLSAQFQGRTVKKTYRAILEGNLKTQTGSVALPLGRDKKDRKRIAVVPDGREALTDYRVLSRFKNNCYAAFDIHTGRTHQIRVHAKALGHPVVGDAVYGYKNQRFRTEGQLLHAFGLGFCHPTGGGALCFTAPPPARFVEIYNILAAESGLPPYDYRADQNACFASPAKD